MSHTHLVESGQGHDTVQQAFPAQIDQFSAVAGVQEVDLQGNQLCQPLAA